MDNPIKPHYRLGINAVNYKKGALDSQPQVIVYQMLAHGRWFSPGTLASSTTKTDRHDIAEILLKVALKHQKSNQIIFYNLNGRQTPGDGKSSHCLWQ
jgi:hypothetical protein